MNRFQAFKGETTASTQVLRATDVSQEDSVVAYTEPVRGNDSAVVFAREKDAIAAVTLNAQELRQDLRNTYKQIVGCEGELAFTRKCKDAVKVTRLEEELEDHHRFLVKTIYVMVENFACGWKFVPASNRRLRRTYKRLGSELLHLQRHLFDDLAADVLKEANQFAYYAAHGDSDPEYREIQRLAKIGKTRDRCIDAFVRVKERFKRRDRNETEATEGVVANKTRSCALGLAWIHNRCARNGAVDAAVEERHAQLADVRQQITTAEELVRALESEEVASCSLRRQNRVARRSIISMVRSMRANETRLMCELQDAQHFLAELQVDFEDTATELTQQASELEVELQATQERAAALAESQAALLAQAGELKGQLMQAHEYADTMEESNEQLCTKEGELKQQLREARTYANNTAETQTQLRAQASELTNKVGTQAAALVRAQQEIDTLGAAHARLIEERAATNEQVAEFGRIKFELETKALASAQAAEARREDLRILRKENEIMRRQKVEAELKAQRMGDNNVNEVRVLKSELSNITAQRDLAKRDAARAQQAAATLSQQVHRLEEAAADDRAAQANEVGRIQAERSLEQETDINNEMLLRQQLGRLTSKVWTLEEKAKCLEEQASEADARAAEGARLIAHKTRELEQMRQSVAELQAQQRQSAATHAREVVTLRDEHRMELEQSRQALKATEAAQEERMARALADQRAALKKEFDRKMAEREAALLAEFERKLCEAYAAQQAATQAQLAQNRPEDSVPAVPTEASCVVEEEVNNTEESKVEALKLRQNAPEFKPCRAVEQGKLVEASATHQQPRRSPHAPASRHVLDPSVRELHRQNNLLPPPPQQQQRGDMFHAHNGQRMHFRNNAQARAMMMPGLEAPAPPSFFVPPSNFASRPPVSLLPRQPAMQFMHAPVGPVFDGPGMHVPSMYHAQGPPVGPPFDHHGYRSHPPHPAYER